WLFERIQHIKGGDEVEGIRREGNRRHGGARETRPAGLAADFQPDGRQIEAESAPVLSKEYQVVAGAAPAVEDQRSAAAFGRLTEQRCDEQSEATKPEMSRFSARRRAQQMLHRRNCSVSRIDT